MLKLIFSRSHSSLIVYCFSTAIATSTIAYTRPYSWNCCGGSQAYFVFGIHFLNVHYISVMRVFLQATGSGPR